MENPGSIPAVVSVGVGLILVGGGGICFVAHRNDSVTACEIRNPELPRKVHFRAIFAPKCIKILCFFIDSGSKIDFSVQNPDSGSTRNHPDVCISLGHMSVTRRENTES